MRGLQLQPHCTYQGKNPITSNDYNFRQPHCQSKKRQMIQPQHYNDQRKNKKMRARNLYMAKCPILLVLVLVLVLPNTKKFTGGLASFLFSFFAWLHGDSKQSQLRKSISITPNDQNSFDIWPPYMIFLIGLLKLIFCQAWIMNFCQKVSAKKTTYFPPFIWK